MKVFSFNDGDGWDWYNGEIVKLIIIGEFYNKLVVTSEMGIIHYYIGIDNWNGG